MHCVPFIQIKTRMQTAVASKLSKAIKCTKLLNVKNVKRYKSAKKLFKYPTFRASPLISGNNNVVLKNTTELMHVNTLSFCGAIYRQVAGVAMGSKMGPNYACLFVGYMEEAILSQ